MEKEYTIIKFDDDGMVTDCTNIIVSDYKEEENPNILLVSQQN